MLRSLPLLTLSIAALGAVTGFAVAADDLASDNSSIDGAFAEAVAHAQKRTVKIFGAAIGRSPGYGTGLIVSP